jgi:pimeloyl-ACP methyl ester carboxylesterase
MTKRPWILLVVVAVVAAAVIAVVAATNGSDKKFVAPKPNTSSAPAGLSAFYDQKVKWNDCGSDTCATVKVPIDYDKPDGATTTLAVKVIPSTSGKATHSMFVNPGGPGGSAIDYADTMKSEFGKDVRAKYDIVGVDPRGVGKSSPLKCLSDKQFDAFTAADPDPDNATEIKEFRHSTTELGTACEKHSGELAAHVSTEEAARDMDVVRALLGRKTMDWFGASYGTQLGATYAQLFPKKVDRMVLDGAIDPSLGVVDSSLGQTTGFERAVDAYAKDCVKSSSCPLGDNADAGIAKIASLLAQLDAKPMKTGTDRQLTEGLAFYGIAVTLYDKSTWKYLTQGLTQAFRGDGSTLLLLSDAYFDRQPNGTYSGNIGQVIYAVNCLDVSDRLTQSQTEALIPRFEKISPVFGRALAWGALGCTDWPIKATHPQLKISADGAKPIVVIGTTRDPATPYEWAQSLAKQLSSGVMVTRVGDGHTAYGSGNTCIKKAIDAYYVSDTVPKDGLVCK